MSNIITRTEAIDRGLSRYFTGSPCKHGHVAERNTVNGGCVICHNIAQKARNAEDYLRRKSSGATPKGQLKPKAGETSFTKEARYAKGKKWQEANPKKVQENSKKHYENNKELYNKRATNNRLVRNLGITTDEYDDIMRQHDGKCDICETTEPGGPHKTFNLDHDHSTGKIRGVLCRRCNTSIGQFKDSVTLLKKAIRYLEDHEAADLYRS